VAHYRIRLIGGPLLHFPAARCRYEGDVLVFEDERPGGWKVVWEIHMANVDQVIDGAIPPPPQWPARHCAASAQPTARPPGAGHQLRERS